MYSSYNVVITTKEGITYMVGYWFTKNGREAVQACKLSHPGHRAYKAVKKTD